MASSQSTPIHKRKSVLVTRKVLCYKRSIALQRLTAHGSCSSGDEGSPGVGWGGVTRSLGGEGTSVYVDGLILVYTGVSLL